ncbi:hypothetical protein HanIR_Chr14g0695111 [Helianthus annuus]|nr:hypothetical protein HanIR_Chr14g0695111 [Helianthus annuus]
MYACMMYVCNYVCIFVCMYVYLRYSGCHSPGFRVWHKSSGSQDLPQTRNLIEK